MIVIPQLNYNYMCISYAPTLLLNHWYYSQAPSQNSEMEVGWYGGLGAEPPAFENFVFFVAKVT